MSHHAELYRVQGKYAQAGPLFKRALAIVQKARGPDHPDVVPFLEDYALLLRRMNRVAEGAKMEPRAKAIRTNQAKESPTK